MARGPSADDGATLLPDLLLDRYRVEGRLGEGGLGTVVKAFDTRLKRTVAIKTLKRTLAATEPAHYRALEDRFNREAEAGSRVGDHPNLVTVYDLVMDAERTQYLICQFVPGGTLAERIAQGPLPRADALRLTTDVARGLQVAHDAGIVHRDIKPANIFLAADGRAQVGDFGIAQMDHLSNRTHATSSHPGTPLYMSPEQAQTTGYVRPNSDQYSLGLVLFEMLTGTAYKRLRERQVEALLAEQPPAVAALIRQMTAPHPDDRYDSMNEVIAAITESQQQPDSPVVAPVDVVTRPPPPPEPKPDTPRLGDVTVRDSPPRTPPTVPAIVPVAPPPLASPPRTPPERSGGLPAIEPQARPKPGISRRALLFGAGGLVVAAGGTGAALFAAQQAGNTPQATATAAPARPAPIAPTSTAAPTRPAPVSTAAPAATSVPAPTVTPGPDLRISTANVNNVGILHTLSGHTGAVTGLGFSADSQTIATASYDSTARLWRTSDGATIRTIATQLAPGILYSVAFSPDGQTIATGEDYGTARLWRVSDGMYLHSFSGHTGPVLSVAFSPDGQTVATASGDTTARLWRVSDGTLLRTLSGHINTVWCVAFSPDGQILATGSDDKTARLWRVADATPLRTLSSHTAAVSGVAFSPEGQILATGSLDKTARLWRVTDVTSLRVFSGLNARVNNVAFSPDGQILAAGLSDASVPLWRVSDGTLLRTLTGHTAAVNSVAFSPNGEMLASASDDGTVLLGGVRGT